MNPAKPPELRAVEGNPGHRPINFGPTFSDDKFGPPPKHLPKTGKKLWKKISRELEANRIGASIYRVTLEGLCVAYCRALEADNDIKLHGTTQIAESGYEAQRASVGISANCWKAVKMFAAELGITPSSKGKVQTPKGKSGAIRDKLMGMRASPKRGR